MNKSDLVIGERFRQLRMLLQKTQVQMSEELEITQANMSKIEAGKCLPNFSFQQRLADRFPEVNFNWILYGEGEPIREKEINKLIDQIEGRVKKELRKEYEKKFAEMNKKILKLEEDNSKLIQILSDKK